MPSDLTDPEISADDAGIHVRGTKDRDIVVHWGEIESISATWHKPTDGDRFLEIVIGHMSGVDFIFHNVETGYEKVMAVMEQRLIGFSRQRAEAVGVFEEEYQMLIVWERDIAAQPFELSPPPVITRGPSPEEVLQMDAARRATLATCEKKLGRPLNAEELRCIEIGFENGRIVGNIAPPLSAMLNRE